MHIATGTENVEAGVGIHDFISGAVSPLAEYIANKFCLLFDNGRC